MKILTSAFITILIFFLVSCNPGTFLNGFVGTWVPMDSNSFPIINRLQIEKRRGFYLLAAEDSVSSEQPFFFICEKHRNHISFTPGQYNSEEYDLEYVLKQTSDIYYDRRLKCLYFLNTIYAPSKDRIFEISDNKIKILPEK
jgi:hypothetical protein